MTAKTQSRTVAVTGATGFVGRHVLEALDGRGWNVRLLARHTPAEPLPESTTVTTGSLEDEAALAKLTDGADTILHLAGAIAAPTRGEFFTINQEGTRRLAEAAQRAGVKRFVHMSSLAAREPQLSGYAASKRAAEDVLSGAAVNVAIIRAPAVYGPGDKATLPLIQQLTARYPLIPSKAASRFSLIYAKDLARIAIAALNDEWTGLRDADDGREQGYCWADLAATLATLEDHKITPLFLPESLASGVSWLVANGASLLRRPAMITPGKVRELYHHDWLSREPVLRADPPTVLAQGLSQTLAWYRQKGWLRERPPADKNRLHEGGVKSL